MNRWKYTVIALCITSNALCFEEETYETITSDFDTDKQPQEYRTRPSNNTEASMHRNHEESPTIDPTEKQAVIIAKTTYVMRGGQYEADIIMLNADPKSQYETYVNGKPIQGKYRTTCYTIGLHKYSGFIREKQRETVQEYPFSGEYVVSEPNATVSLDMMNILYAGVKNPISVSAPGFPYSDIEINCTDGTQIKTPQGWCIIPRKPGSTCNVTVYAKIDGKLQLLSQKNYRILRLPTPCGTIKFSDDSTLYTSGEVSKNKMLAATKVSATSELDFLHKYVVTGFNVKFYTQGTPTVLHSNSEEITPEMKRMISRLRDQETCYITDITVKGPDGETLRLAPIEITIQESEKKGDY